MNTRQKVRWSGFSLIELMVSILILSIVMAGIFRQIELAQTRYMVEGQKLDMTQQEREFIDQLTRDLHQAGFPSVAQYGNLVDLNSPNVAAGVWFISENALFMEGDVDGDGIVDSISYTYNDGGSWTGPPQYNPCPCLQRSQIQKIADWPWRQPAAVSYTEVQNIIPVAGQPFFSAFQTDGTPVDLSTPIVLGSNLAVNPLARSALQAMKSVRITFTILGKMNDPNSRQPIQVTMTGMARLPNN